jgi:sterol-4alpha-carboxylate 3-dehydrogenase (decarboxylating)
VYTGSADVVAAGARDVVNADEDSASYPDKVWRLATLHFLRVICSALGSFGFWGGAVE